MILITEFHLVFTLTLQHIIKTESPCYELERIPLKVINPFDEGGEFRVVLVEASADLLDPNKPANLMKPKEKRRRKIRARVDHGIKRPETPPTPPPPRQEGSSFFKKNGKFTFRKTMRGRQYM